MNVLMIAVGSRGDVEPYVAVGTRLIEAGHAVTTGATLRAGVPSVPCPVFADQPPWARRLVELGCAPPALPFRRLDADTLGDAIRDAVTDRRHAERARALSRVVRDGDGRDRVVDLVARIT